jgi:hypothetical protein
LFSPECKNPQRPRENGEIVREREREMKREIQRDRERERPEIEKERLIE